MSKRTDDDSRLAQAVVHIIEALRVKDADVARDHLMLAQKQANVVLNRGLDKWDPEYQTTDQEVT